ncbi:hypothetical protein LOTGIDRAFT_220770 [Lottia gigantea]|uniref:Protein kinase domain-containing protein n=1 Tax=Lottia gigantea TaxID=225164 RepID=V3ZPG6_LOTGI|nr:hypothetical protein LOTGIDRAFT_220770 [Lottia gigantea]ESO86237.1 hypothetical protein LOTGIDRAFT_220770 [Lottia gigantea]
MENFVLYENLGKKDHVTIYKGRRKGTINFVAIHCIDKCKRPEVTNTVRMTHDVSHTNIVQFYEWYETSNHLWLVVELCTGGSLSSLIKQDGYLPESSVRSFGVDLVTGLHYIHSLGIIFNDLQPSKILLDTSGALKYGDFGLSKGDGENLDELFHGFADAGEQWNPENMEDVYKNINTSGNITYSAPEVLQGREPSVLSDLWSLGCIFYELFTGHPPFLAESENQLKEKIINQDFPLPKVRGSRFSAKPSPDYLNLLQGLLQKDPTRRLGWAGLVNHSFWQNKLADLAKDLTVSQDVNRSEIFTGRSSIFEHGAGSVLGKIKGVDIMTDRPTSRLDTPDGRPVLRPKTAPGIDGGESLFTLSARPHTAAHDERIASPFRTLQSPLTTRETIKTDRADDVTEQTTNDLLENIYHPSDFIITNIVDNPKIQKPLAVKYDSKTLPVPPYNVEKILGLPEKEFQKHIKTVVDSISHVEKGPPSQKRIQLLHYTTTITTDSKISYHLIRNQAIYILAKQLKDIQHVDVRLKMARVMALIALNCGELEDTVNISEPVTILTEIIRENVKNSKLKFGLLTAVGEMVYRVAVQEKSKDESCENWSIPSMTYSVISRCCREGEEAVVNHVAAKTVENITSIKGPQAQKFLNSEMGQVLWYLFKHSTVDSIRCTAMTALCRIIWQSPGLFQNVIDTAGLTTILSSLTLGISRVQQAVITMFGALIGTGLHINRLLQDKDFLQKIMRLFESPSTLIRAKAFMVLHELTKSSSDLLLSACNARLVMYIERDSRRQTPRDPRSDSPDSVQYLNQALDKFINYITDALPGIMKEVLTVLESVSGRKHPSANQTRQLKSTLPLLPIGLHLVTSQVFRSRVVNKEFIKDLGLLLGHVNQIENKETNIDASSAAIGTTEFINTVMSILEGISQHPSLLIQYHQVVIETILPSLATLIKSQNVDTKVLSLRLLSEITSVYLSQDQYGHTSETRVDSDRLHQIVSNNLLSQMESLLLDIDPLPSYTLKLLLSLLEQSNNFVKLFLQQGLMPVIFQVLQDHQNNATSVTMQNIISILNCLISNKQTNLSDLYDQGLIDNLTSLVFEVSTLCFLGEETGQDIKASNTTLQILLETLYNILKYVSDIVRKALQAKKSGTTSAGKEAEWAEKLLMFNKPLTDLTSVLTQLLCYEDTDIYEIAIKSLSLLVQLYGGEHKDAMSTENMEYYSNALKKADVKKQKILLRVIKRLVGTDPKHSEKMKVNGEVLANTIKSLVQTASSHADVSMTSLAAEILKTTGYL